MIPNTTTPTRLPPDPRSLEGAAAIAVEALAVARANGDHDTGDLIEGDMASAMIRVVNAAGPILRRSLVAMVTRGAE